MTLYLKYRPERLEDLDLTSVRTTLQKIVSTGKFPHAFLFTGTRGTGKTSSARIIAKVLLCEKQTLDKMGEPCNECETCIAIGKGTHIDVVEMDAASNRGIDDIRALRENIALAPVRGHKKIYIIDEAHMLTTEASNAFLKTLEEPPAHVMFILATTNPEKLPDTIHSRLTTVQFQKATAEEVYRQLKRVIAGEKLTVEDEALAVISKYADGSFRDAVKCLEQLSQQMDTITKGAAEEYLFQTTVLQVDTLLQLLLAKNVQAALAEVERVVTKGGSMKLYLEALMEKLHAEMLLDPTKPHVIELLTALSSVKQQMQMAIISQLPLELAIVNYCGVQEKNLKVSISTQTETKVIETPKVTVTEEKQEITEVKKTEKTEVKIVEGSVDTSAWATLLSQMKVKNTSIEALLRACQPMNFDGVTLTLGVYYQFHKERLEVVHNRKTLEDLAEIAFGRPVRINCLLTEKPKAVEKAKDVLTEPADQDIIKAAKEIFG
jgi:DNA polymerase III subunit gamma/tau